MWSCKSFMPSVLVLLLLPSCRCASTDCSDFWQARKCLGSQQWRERSCYFEFSNPSWRFYPQAGTLPSECEYHLAWGENRGGWVGKNASGQYVWKAALSVENRKCILFLSTLCTDYSYVLTSWKLLDVWWGDLEIYSIRAILWWAGLSSADLSRYLLCAGIIAGLLRA